MFARQVNGLAVTHYRQAREAKVSPVPLSDDPDQVSRIRGVAELTLEDGSITYGCTYCDYTDDGVRAVVSHMGGKHPGESRRSPGEGRSVVAAGVTLRDAIRAVPQVRRLTVQVRELRRRNGELRREVAELRRAVARSQ